LFASKFKSQSKNFKIKCYKVVFSALNWAVAEEDLLGRPVTVAKTGLAILLVGDCGRGFKLVVGVTVSYLC